MEQIGLQLSVENNHSSDCTKVISPGLDGLRQAADVLFAGNSGTTIRLLSGLLAGRPFETSFDGDHSLRLRPMSRVLTPLSQMGARVTYLKEPGQAPFTIAGQRLQGRDFDLDIASAQVEAALLLAGLQADGQTTVKLRQIARDHTIRMFRFLKVPCRVSGDGAISVAKLKTPVPPFQLTVPGDLSCAAFFMVAAACLPGSDLHLPGVGINPGRRLVLDALIEMGADVQIEEQGDVCQEPVSDIRVKGGNKLKGSKIDSRAIAQGVDEIPILALAACLAEGEFIVKGAAELRHKESDRLALISQNIRTAGGDIQDLEDGFIIRGHQSLKGGSLWLTKSDHRLAMCGLIAQLLCDSPVEVEEIDSIHISYPKFKDDLAMLVNS